jgi:hypothetical protein
MTWFSRPSRAWATPLLLALALLPGRAAAQGWRETQLWGVALASQPALFAGGLGFAVRDAGRTRIGGALAAGTSEGGRATGRLEVAWHFLLDPARRQGLAIYGGGGAAISVIAHGRVRPWVLLVLGAETSPAAKHGFFVEAGLGGGARVAAGVRWRAAKKRR